MKVKFDQTLMVLNGTKPIKGIDPYYVGDPKNPAAPLVDMTLQIVATESLLGHNPAEGLSAEKKVQMFGLAQKIVKNKTVDLEVEEIVLIKECVATQYPPLIVGQAFPMLEGK